MAASVPSAFRNLLFSFFVFPVVTLTSGSAVLLKAQQTAAPPQAAVPAQQPATQVPANPATERQVQQAPSVIQIPPSAAGQKRLNIGKFGTVSYPPSWQSWDGSFSNAYVLLRMPQPSDTTSTTATSPTHADLAAQVQMVQTNLGPLAGLRITTEPRTSPAGAARRLQELAISRQATVRFYAISGWPAVELQYTQPLPRVGAATQVQVASQTGAQMLSQQELESQLPFSKPTPNVQSAIIAVAANDDLVIFDIMLAPAASSSVLQEGLLIANSFVSSQPGDSAASARVLQQLELNYDNKVPPQTVPQSHLPSGPGSLGTAAGMAQIQAGGNGELEVAASPNGSTIVIASNSSVTHSIDSGATFAGATAVFGMNDPTLGRGASGAFYLGQIAFPNGTPGQGGITGCTDAVSRSTDGGATFLLSGFSAVCPVGPVGSNFSNNLFCFNDQPHIAADGFTAGPADQVYAVWRELAGMAVFGIGINNCTQVSGGFLFPSISCSVNNGATWTTPAAIPGTLDFPRIAVGMDGKVYVTALSGSSVVLYRFSSCVNGLALDPGFPVTVANLTGQVACPVPGLDRCNNGNGLSSPTVAPDPANAGHLSVSFAEQDGSGGERIVTMDSMDAGTNFPMRFLVSAAPSARRFMPWSCMTGGNTFVGWYDRGAATAPQNDLTDYVVGGTSVATPVTVTDHPDRQCVLWPCAPRSTSDSTSCSLPEKAGKCLNGSGTGSGALCDFNAPSCPNPGESCQTGIGCPKYGDYNGMACAGGTVIAAWASATAPNGFPARQPGIGIFSQTLTFSKTGTPTFDTVTFLINTGNDNAASGLELVAAIPGQKNQICLKPSTGLPPDVICANGNGATDHNHQNTWNNFTSNTQTFTLDTPQTTAAAFPGVTITSLQSSCLTYCDNWDLQGISITVSDSTGTLPPAVLLNIFVPQDPHNNDNCMARLKAPPGVNSVTYTLNAAAPTSSPSNFGTAPPGSCPQ